MSFNLFDLYVKIGVEDKASDAISKITKGLGSGLATAAKVGTAAIGAASTGIAALTKSAVDNFAEFEQLVGGAEKIFDELDQSEILDDANNAYKELNMSAIQYLSIINDVGASFSSTMGDAKGYDTAVQGLKAISDYATGTGKSVDELTGKFTLITRSTSSYQSIADQFSGILPATSAAFLEQAQAAGVLEKSYKQLTDVPLNEYQAAVAAMLESGVEKLGLASNTVLETEKTISGSAAAVKASWSNLVTSLADDTGDFETAFRNFTDSAGSFLGNVVPRIEEAVQGVSGLVESASARLPEFLDYAIASINEQLTKEDGILATGGKIVGTVVDAVLDNAPQLLDTGVEILTNIARGVTGKLEDGTIQAATDSIIDTAVGFLTNRDGKLTEFAAAAGEMVDALGGFIKDSAFKIGAGAREVANSFVAWFTSEDGQEMLDAAGDKIVSGVNAGLKKWGHKAGSAGHDLAMEILSGIASTDFSDIGDILWDKISAPLNEQNTFVGAGARFMDSFVAGWKDSAENMDRGYGANATEFYESFDYNEHVNAFKAQQEALDIGRQTAIPDTGDSWSGEGRTVYNNTTLNIYSQAQTAADLMEEALYQQQLAAMMP